MNEPVTLDTITKLAAKASQANQRVKEVITLFEHDLRQLEADHKPGIEQASRKLRAAEDALRAAVEVAPELFAKPKTRTLFHYKVGYRKEPDDVVHGDPAETIKLIRANLNADAAAVLIQTKETIVASALKNLDDAQLEKIQAKRVIGEDVIVCNIAEGSAESLVKALVKRTKQEVETDAVASDTASEELETDQAA